MYKKPFGLQPKGFCFHNAATALNMWILHRGFSPVKIKMIMITAGLPLVCNEGLVVIEFETRMYLFKNH
ncbi:MAG: hypothetical protein AB7S72_01110 [Draconibacterium sp.]